MSPQAIDVLVVDHDEDFRSVVVGAVTGLDFRCRSARDGREALDEQAREAAAIVLADWRMPGVDGLELCQALKRDPSPPYVILMTVEHEQAQRFGSSGADGYLRKPFGLDALEARLLAAARCVRAQRDLVDMKRREVFGQIDRKDTPPTG
jgi:sigma-B regulation protein RsbU (phosphoserine phosphatase)